MNPPEPHDPKREAGSKKCPLHLVPAAPIHEMAWVLKNGADKYGERNWSWPESEVLCSTYYSAMRRHLDLWFYGPPDGSGPEDVDPESGRHHMIHNMANNAIVFDAMQAGTLVDDRPRKGVKPRSCMEAVK